MIEQYEGEAMTVGALFHRDFQKSLLVDMADALESMSCHYTGHVVSTQRSAQVDRWGQSTGTIREEYSQEPLKELQSKLGERGEKIIRAGFKHRKAGPMILSVREPSTNSEYFLVDLAFASDELGIPVKARKKEDRSSAKWRWRFTLKLLDLICGAPGCLYAGAGNEVDVPTPEEITTNKMMRQSLPAVWGLPSSLCDSRGRVTEDVLSSGCPAAVEQWNDHVTAIKIWSPLDVVPADHDAEAIVLGFLGTVL